MNKGVSQFKKLSSYERQKEIVNLLKKQFSVQFSELSSLFHVTEMTIRRDIEKLVDEGILHRTVGGAILNEIVQIDLVNRMKLMSEEKARIGKKAASLIQSKDVVYIDAGTTTLHLAKQIILQDITVITNAPNIALELQNRGVLTILLGGQLDNSTLSAIGPITLKNIEHMNFKRAFISTTGISVASGLTNANYFELEVKKLAIQNSQEVNIVADSSKFDKDSLVSFAELNEVNRIITDKSIPAELGRVCERLGIEVLVA